MSKEKSFPESDEERRICVAESLTSFSKHLMLLLVAVIAFAATPVLNDSPQYLQFCFAFGVVIGIASIFCGHEAITIILSAYIQKDSHDNFINLGDSLTKGTLQKCKKLVEIQYWFVLVSLFIIALCIMVSVFVVKKTPINCIVTNNSLAATPANSPVAPSSHNANSGNAAIKNDPNPAASQPKQMKPVKP